MRISTFPAFSRTLYFFRGEAIKKIKSSAKGRKCRYPRCGHILSIYNHEEYCHVHLSQLPLDHKPKHQKASE